MRRLVLTIYVLFILCLFITKIYAWYPDWQPTIPRLCQTDWQCVNDCTANGYQWGYCKSVCTWCQ